MSKPVTEVTITLDQPLLRTVQMGLEALRLLGAATESKINQAVADTLAEAAAAERKAEKKAKVKKPPVDAPAKTNGAAVHP